MILDPELLSEHLLDIRGMKDADLVFDGGPLIESLSQPLNLVVIQFASGTPASFFLKPFKTMTIVGINPVLNCPSGIAEKGGNLGSALIHQGQIDRSDTGGDTRILLPAEQLLQFLTGMIQFYFQNGLLK
jgi:hypothetical protein